MVRVRNSNQRSLSLPLPGLWLFAQQLVQDLRRPENLPDRRVAPQGDDLRVREHDIGVQEGAARMARVDRQRDPPDGGHGAVDGARFDDTLEFVRRQCI